MLTCALGIESKSGIPGELYPNLESQMVVNTFRNTFFWKKKTSYIDGKFAPEPDKLGCVRSNLLNTTVMGFQGCHRF